MDRDSLAAVTQSLPDAVVVIDPVGGVLWVNDAVERIFGRTPAELVGTNALDVVHPEDKALAGVALTSIQGKAVGTPIELRVLAGEGWKLVEVIASNLLDHSTVGGLILCVRDLTERRRWEVANDEIGRFRSLVHNAASILMLLEPTGEIDSVSAAITRLLGHDQELESAAQAVVITHDGSHLDDVRGERDGKLQGNNFADPQLAAEGRADAVQTEFAGSAPEVGGNAFAKHRHLDARVEATTGETPLHRLSFGGAWFVVAQSRFSVSDIPLKPNLRLCFSARPKEDRVIG